ncbi:MULTISPECIES: HAD-IIIC family phosphatase [unclassified Rhodanobacter]|uniref:HAD-IIIC family phosphatase n=1 Tax=unclassified Rhodanobacter TaxID=2621553 RepID=UPI0009ECC9AC|nr:MULTISPECIES: HAD-IIIC family phosphatase [unclassified Rhodanobacter]
MTNESDARNFSDVRLASFQIIRNFTIEAIAPFLTRALVASGLSANLRFGGFATAHQEIAQGDMPGTDGAMRITVLALGLEESAPNFGHMNWPVTEACEHILTLVRMAAATWGSPLCINTVLAPLFQPWGLAHGSEFMEAENAIAALNSELRAIATAASGRIILCDWERYARLLGEQGTYDYRFWYSSRAPFAASFLKLYAEDIARTARVLSGRIRKCLVLDCDNTLWGGIVGEDGLGGIRLSTDTVPGRYFHEFQRSVLDLAERGVILALSSKNNEADVMEVLNSHPDCLIRRDHLASWRISWAPKHESLVELADELGINLDSMVFVDDNPAECELVRQALPQVAVIQVPDRLEQLPSLLFRNDLFGTLTITETDRRRAESYRVQRERRDLQRTVKNPKDYLASLGTRVVLRLAGERDVARVVQLLQRTNQFNLTTRRHDESIVRELLTSPSALLLVCDVSDRFGSMGLTGVLLALRKGNVAEIDSLLLSCRVLGREVEFAFVAAAADWLRREWKTETIDAKFIPSAKNMQCADFWERCGFARNSSLADGVIKFRAVDVTEVISFNNRQFITIEVEA